MTVNAWIRHGLADPLGPAAGLDIPTPQAWAGDLMTLSEFAVETTVDDTTLYRWARLGLLDELITVDGNGNRCLTRAAADRFLATWPQLSAAQADQWLYPGEVLQLLGITHSALATLVRRGEIVAVRGPSGHHRMRADSLPR